MFDQHILAWLFVHMYDPGRQSVAEQQGGGPQGGQWPGDLYTYMTQVGRAWLNSKGKGQGRGDTSCAIWKRGGLWGGER